MSADPTSWNLEIRRVPHLDDVQLVHVSDITHDYPRHVHEEYCIAMILKGTETHICRGSSYTAFPGDMLLLNAGEAHSNRSVCVEYKSIQIHPRSFIRLSQRKSNYLQAPDLPGPSGGNGNGFIRALNQQMTIGFTDTLSPTQLFEDTSFEETGGGGTFWTTDDSVSGTNLCDSTCDDGGTVVAHTGEWFVWFGGWDQQNTSSLSQSVVFPAGQARWLNYWLINQIGGDPTAQLTLSIDGTSVLTFDAQSGEDTYAAHTFEVPAQYLDGQSHLVEFDFSADSAAGEVGGAMLDDVTLDCDAQPTSVPTRHAVAAGRRAH